MTASLWSFVGVYVSARCSFVCDVTVAVLDMVSTENAPTNMDQLKALLQNDTKVKVAGWPNLMNLRLFNSPSYIGIDGMSSMICHVWIDSSDESTLNSGWCFTGQVYGKSTLFFSQT